MSVVAPIATVSPSVAPVVTQTLVATPAPTPDPTLLTQIGHVDPLIWTALVGALIVPFLHTQLKKFASFLNDKKHRTTNYFIAGVLNLVVGYGFDLQNSGVLAHLHNPAVGGLLATGLSFLLGQQVYGFFVKTNEELNKTTPALAPVLDTLPRTATP